MRFIYLLGVIAVVFVSACVQQFSGFQGLMKLYSPEVSESPTDLIAIQNFNLIPPSPISAENDFTISFELKNIDPSKEVKSVDVCVYDTGMCVRGSDVRECSGVVSGGTPGGAKVTVGGKKEPCPYKCCEGLEKYEELSSCPRGYDCKRTSTISDPINEQYYDCKKSEMVGICNQADYKSCEDAYKLSLGETKKEMCGAQYYKYTLYKDGSNCAKFYIVAEGGLASLYAKKGGCATKSNYDSATGAVKTGDLKFAGLKKGDSIYAFAELAQAGTQYYSIFAWEGGC